MRRSAFTEYAALDLSLQAPTADEEVNLHFSCFVEGELDGKKYLIELDGRRPGPINRKTFHLYIFDDR